MSAPNILALLKEADELPKTDRCLLTHNERELIEFCNRLAFALRWSASAPSTFTPDELQFLQRKVAADLSACVWHQDRYGLSEEERADMGRLKELVAKLEALSNPAPLPQSAKAMES